MLALAAAAAALVLGLLQRTVPVVWSPVFVLALVHLGGRAASLLGADDVTAAQQTLLSEARDLLLLPVLTALIASLPAPRRAAQVAVAVLALLAGLTVLQEFVFANTTDFGGLSNVPLGQDVGAATVRHSGPEADVNFWGRTLVLFLPLALALLACARGYARWAWAGAAAALCGGEYLTQSRGGLVALVVAAVLGLLLSGRPVRQLALLVVVALGAALLVPGVASRVATLGMVQAGPPSLSDRSLVDRAAVQQVGLAMFADAPLTGVGAGNFEIVEPEYRRRVAPQLSQVLAPHNLYLQMLAEGGVVGLLAWLAFYAGAVLVALRAYLISRALAGPQAVRTEGALAAGVVAGLVGWGVASAFLHVSSLTVLAVPIALGAVLDVRARARLAAAPLPRPALLGRRAQPSQPLLAGRALHVLGAVLLVLGAVGGLLLARAPSGARWVATARAVVAPAGASQGSAYATDVLSRQTVVLTYAALAREPTFLQAAVEAADLPPAAAGEVEVSVVQAPSTDVIDVVIAAPGREDAGRLATGLLRQVQDYVGATNGLYVLRPLGGEQTRREQPPARRLLPLALAVSGGLCLALALLHPVLRRLLPRRRPRARAAPAASR